MRVSLCALVICGALSTASVLQPALAQSEGAAQGAAAVKRDDGFTERDVKTAMSELISAWHNYQPCNRAKLCSAYFESYGVAITFNDGTIAPFSHTQRLRATGHDCIVRALTALDHGDRGMAVQWVMASYLHDALYRNWLADHPDAVIAALHGCCH
jgi:hypothetical protein